MEERQHSLQSVTCNNSPEAARSNGPNPDKGINSAPLISQNTDFHLNEIGRALNEVDPKKDSSHIGTHSNLPFTESCPHVSVKNISTFPDSIGNGSTAFNSGLQSELNTHEAINSARDNQSPRAATLAPKPQWTRVCHVSSTPQEEVSQGNLNYGKRSFTLNDDHSKLPNKRCQVSRSEKDDYTILAEAEIQPC
nr:hypothetical protein CFP56_39575 [Quercus suber]